MANQEAFYSKSDLLKSKGQETRISFVLATGYLVVIEGE
jgi:hypothetical protein